MNNLIIFVEILVLFSMLLIANKLFGKKGIFVWVALAAVFANVVQGKNAMIFGLYAGIGHVLFSSNFLATDILNECYSQEDAKTAVKIGLFANVLYIIVMMIALWYQPSDIDTLAQPMSQIFGLNIRIALSSMLWYVISNFGDVWLFDKIKHMTGGKYLWLRNNVATIIFNCLENFGFAFCAFAGVYETKQIISIALASTIIEIIVGICDTPFLYLAKYINDKPTKLKLKKGEDAC